MKVKLLLLFALWSQLAWSQKSVEDQIIEAQDSLKQCELLYSKADERYARQCLVLGKLSLEHGKAFAKERASITEAYLFYFEQSGESALKLPTAEDFNHHHHLLTDTLLLQLEALNSYLKSNTASPELVKQLFDFSDLLLDLSLEKKIDLYKFVDAFLYSAYLHESKINPKRKDLLDFYKELEHNKSRFRKGEEAYKDLVHFELELVVFLMNTIEGDGHKNLLILSDLYTLLGRSILFEEDFPSLGNYYEPLLIGEVDLHARLLLENTDYNLQKLHKNKPQELVEVRNQLNSPILNFRFAALLFKNEFGLPSSSTSEEILDLLKKSSAKKLQYLTDFIDAYTKVWELKLELEQTVPKNKQVKFLSNYLEYSFDYAPTDIKNIVQATQKYQQLPNNKLSESNLDLNRLYSFVKNFSEEDRDDFLSEEFDMYLPPDVYDDIESFGLEGNALFQNLDQKANVCFKYEASSHNFINQLLAVYPGNGYMQHAPDFIRDNDPLFEETMLAAKDTSYLDKDKWKEISEFCPNDASAYCDLLENSIYSKVFEARTPSSEHEIILKDQRLLFYIAAIQYAKDLNQAAAYLQKIPKIWSPLVKAETEFLAIEESEEELESLAFANFWIKNWSTYLKDPSCQDCEASNKAFQNYALTQLTKALEVLNKKERKQAFLKIKKEILNTVFQGRVFENQGSIYIAPDIVDKINFIKSLKLFPEDYLLEIYENIFLLKIDYKHVEYELIEEYLSLKFQKKLTKKEQAYIRELYKRQLLSYRALNEPELEQRMLKHLITESKDIWPAKEFKIYWKEYSTLVGEKARGSYINWLITEDYLVECLKNFSTPGLRGELGLEPHIIEDPQLLKARNFHTEYFDNLVVQAYQNILETENKPTILIEAYFELAKIRLEQGEVLVATEHFSNLAKLLNARITKNYTELPEADRQLFFDNLKPKYDAFYRFVIGYGSEYPELYTQLLNTHMLIKGLGLEHSSNIQQVVYNSENLALKQLYGRMQEIKKQIAASSRMSPEEMIKRKVNRLALYYELEAKKDSLGQASAALRTFFQQENKEVNYAEIQANLDEDEIAIDYIILSQNDNNSEDYYYAILIKKDQQYPQFIELCSVEDLSYSLEQRVQPNNINYITTPSESYFVYQLIFEPLLPYLQNYHKLHLCPTGGLSKVAFGPLVMNEYNLERIMDKYSIYYHLSLRNFENLKEITPENPKIALLGGAKFSLNEKDLSSIASKRNLKFTPDQKKPLVKDQNNDLIAMAKSRGEDFTPLPGTLKEVQKIKALFTKNNWDTIVLTGLDAMEERLTQIIEERAPTILHIATHGFFFPKTDEEPNSNKKRNTNSVEKRISSIEDPLLRSGLALTGVNQVWKGGQQIEGLEDGIFTALEVSNLNLSKTDLVVLSACETAKGDINTNEGVIGLQRAFKMAGAKRLIISLWKVPDDQTAELMELFYQYYLSSKSISTAFEEAQKEMRRRYRNPYYWAAFILIE